MRHPKFKTFFIFIIIIFAGIFHHQMLGGFSTSSGSGILNKASSDDSPSPVELIPEDKRTIPDLILLGARQEVCNQVVYDASYIAIRYPLGDVPADKGACTDVIVRAFRKAGIDLQQLIHEDMKKNFTHYPQDWNLKQPDPNIDHRRVPNQVAFFKNYGLELTTDTLEFDEWRWGDIVYWQFPINGLDHCGVISDKKTEDGHPLVIHNAATAIEEDCLTRWKITGHYRYPAIGTSK